MGIEDKQSELFVRRDVVKDRIEDELIDEQSSTLIRFGTLDNELDRLNDQFSEAYENDEDEQLSNILDEMSTIVSEMEQLI